MKSRKIGVCSREVKASRKIGPFTAISFGFLLFCFCLFFFFPHQVKNRAFCWECIAVDKKQAAWESGAGCRRTHKSKYKDFLYTKVGGEEEHKSRYKDCLYTKGGNKNILPIFFSRHNSIQIRYPSNFALMEGMALSSQLPDTGHHSL